MTSEDAADTTPRIATTGEADVVAHLLDAFNTEFDTPTPGAPALAPRVAQLLAEGQVIALLAGRPPVGLAVLTLGPNVWYDGPVALLDELYVAPDRRGQGLGTQLLRHAEQVARGRGAELLEINVDGEDVDARRFYERHGYSCTEPGQSEPSYYYSRELA